MHFLHNTLLKVVVIMILYQWWVSKKIGFVGGWMGGLSSIQFFLGFLEFV